MYSIARIYAIYIYFFSLIASFIYIICAYIGCSIPIPGYVPGYEGMYPVPSAKGYALYTLGPGYDEMYTHKTLKKKL